MLTPTLLRKAKAELRKRDPQLDKLSKIFRQVGVPSRNPSFEGLVSIIIGQQLSGAAARTIFGRFKRLFNGRAVTPQKLLALEPHAIRECGVSFGKIKAMTALSNHFLENPRFLQKLSLLDDEKAYDALTELHGIGAWSAGVFLLFSLKRSDILPRGDATLTRAINSLYGTTIKSDRLHEIEHITDRWRPYRSVVALALWAWVDAKTGS